MPIAPCGAFFKRRAEPCVACHGGEKPGCTCTGCVAGMHRTEGVVQGDRLRDSDYTPRSITIVGAAEAQRRRDAR